MNIEHHSLSSEGASVGATGCGPVGLGSTPSPHPNVFPINDLASRLYDRLVSIASDLQSLCKCVAFGAESCAMARYPQDSYWPPAVCNCPCHREISKLRVDIRSEAS